MIGVVSSALLSKSRWRHSRITLAGGNLQKDYDAATMMQSQASKVDEQTITSMARKVGERHDGPRVLILQAGRQ